MSPGVYKFDQADSSNSGHPLLFYREAAKTTAYTTGVVTSGTPGNAGAHTTITITKDTPSTLHYQCSAHATMGGVLSNIGSESPTIRMVDDDKIFVGTGNDLEIYHTGTQSIISDAGTGNLNLEGDSKIVLRSTGGTENYAQFNKDGAVELYYDNSKKIETASTGITVTGHILPGAHDTYDLGASGNEWANIYTGDLNLSNMNKEQGNDVDGTKGNWTIQEGDENLFLLNNNSGKKYKFTLEEI